MMSPVYAAAFKLSAVGASGLRVVAGSHNHERTFQTCNGILIRALKRTLALFVADVRCGFHSIPTYAADFVQYRRTLRISFNTVAGSRAPRRGASDNRLGSTNTTRKRAETGLSHVRDVLSGVGGIDGDNAANTPWHSRCEPVSAPQRVSFWFSRNYENLELTLGG
jgi:hypothetical protein